MKARRAGEPGTAECGGFTMKTRRAKKRRKAKELQNSSSYKAEKEGQARNKRQNLGRYKRRNARKAGKRRRRAATDSG
jgi:hypothetical protein